MTLQPPQVVDTKETRYLLLPEKAEKIARYCDRWYLAIGDENIVQEGELPKGCHPDQVWPRRVAEREAKLGKEYPDWFDAAGNLRPDIPKKQPISSAEGSLAAIRAKGDALTHNMREYSADSDSAATQTPLTADTGADQLPSPLSPKSAPVLQFPKKETA
jgi:hypothetical protein